MHFSSLVVSLLFCGISASAADNTSILSPSIDTFINNLLSEWNSPGGASVAVVRADGQGGWSVETKGYGIAKVDGTKVTPDAIFSIGSNSKVSLPLIPLLMTAECVSLAFRCFSYRALDNERHSQPSDLLEDDNCVVNPQLETHGPRRVFPEHDYRSYQPPHGHASPRFQLFHLQRHGPCLGELVLDTLLSVGDSLTTSR